MIALRLRDCIMINYWRRIIYFRFLRAVYWSLLWWQKENIFAFFLVSFYLALKAIVVKIFKNVFQEKFLLRGAYENQTRSDAITITSSYLKVSDQAKFLPYSVQQKQWTLLPYDWTETQGYCSCQPYDQGHGERPWEPVCRSWANFSRHCFMWPVHYTMHT